MLFELLEFVHILSAAVIFGTGLGIAFFMWRAHVSRDVRAIAAVAKQVVLADFLFTAPAVIVQPVTGYFMAVERGWPLLEGWLGTAILLYILAGACWLPVVRLQMRARDMAAAAAESGAPLPAAYFQTMRIWFILGWPAFIAVMAIFYLMINKPGL